jgi:hypothetical protein
MRQALILFLLLGSLIAWTQNDSSSRHGFFLPRNIDECITQLDISFTSSAKQKFKKLSTNELRSLRGIYIIDEWFETDSTRTSKYFDSLHIPWQDFEDRDYLILYAYHQYLNNVNFDFIAMVAEVTRKNDSISSARKYRYEQDIKADSIEGVYIPKDIYDCYSRLDKILPDSIKSLIVKDTADNYVIGMHMGLGRWMRNYWGLWGGSRLQTYFLQNGVNHPDEMSSVILFGYAEYLQGKRWSLEDLLIEIKRTFFVPPPEILEQKVKFDESLGYTKEYKRFLRTRKIREIDN